mmetsp:Transcript_49298/g.104802  ORF Transcript_49298/g.104802 Transcript_49298/m.104802 type:complete len:231 (+) Transcript_49298:535-1227(+)
MPPSLPVRHPPRLDLPAQGPPSRRPRRPAPHSAHLPRPRPGRDAGALHRRARARRGHDLSRGVQRRRVPRPRPHPSLPERVLRGGGAKVRGGHLHRLPEGVRRRAPRPDRSRPPPHTTPRLPRLLPPRGGKLPQGPDRAGAGPHRHGAGGQQPPRIRVPGGQRHTDRELVRRSARQGAAQAGGVPEDAARGGGREGRGEEDVSDASAGVGGLTVNDKNRWPRLDRVKTCQ